MRRTLGWIIFILGLIVLGWWGKTHQAVRIQDQITNEANDLTASLNENLPSADLTSSVSGRDIEVSGTLPEEDVATVTEEYNNLEGRRVVRTNFETIKTVSPYTMNVTKEEAGSLIVEGYAENKESQAELSNNFTGANANIEIASGAPENWETAVQMGSEALGKLDYGQLSLSDQNVTLTGFAATPEIRAEAEAQLASLPEGYKADISIDAPVEGPDFKAEFDITKGLTITGNSTEDGTDQRIAEDLSAPIVSSDLKNENVGSIENVEGRLRHIGSYLERFDTATITATEEQVTFTGKATVGAMTDAEIEDFKSGFAEGDTVEIETSSPENNATRINVLSGEDEYYSQAGYWLPAVDFEPAVLSCTENTLVVMQGQTINFVTGSAQLDASNRALINKLAGLFNKCLGDGGLALEIGGHTDADGDDQANMELSQARAEAVLAAIEERGVDITNVQAKGYGETQPIATNDTAEGKAQNRRTTFEWSEKN